MVELSNDSVIVPDGADLLAYQYFENVRNFLQVVEELGIPTFEASDFDKVVALLVLFFSWIRNLCDII